MVLIGGCSGVTVGLYVGDHCPVPSPEMLHCCPLLFLLPAVTEEENRSIFPN